MSQADRPASHAANSKRSASRRFQDAGFALCDWLYGWWLYLAGRV